MKKFLFIVLVNLLLFNYLEGQIKYGIGFGPHNSTIIEKNDIPNWDLNYGNFYSARHSFHAGIFAEIPLDSKRNWAIQSSVSYYGKGRNFSKSYDSTHVLITDTSSINSTWKINYLDIPVNIVYRIPLSSKVRLILGVGPYISFFFKGKTTYEMRNAYGEYSSLNNKLPAGDDVNKYSTTDWGINGLIGFDFNDRFLLTENFSRSLSSIYTAEYNGTFYNRVYGTTLVFWLNKLKKAPAKSKIADRDKDGIPDAQDACPDVAGSTTANGCPDKDGDGVPDSRDKCPNVSGMVKYQGCPVPDTDGDGIDDEKDSCVNVAGLLIYHGCPVPDSDGDGIKDSDDKCPQVPGVAKYGGCPIPDTDGDGVNDEIDKCPTKPGKIENNGCPAVVQEDLKALMNSIAHNILFAVSSEKIDPSSYKSLDKLVSIMQKNPSLKLDIEGHTDNTGARKYNQILSGKRALAIKSYLIQKGINKDRMTASGFGPDKPIASNNTDKGKSKNRRVELKLRY